jgi:cysteine synthase A
MLGSGLPQSRADDGSPSSSHPAFRPHAVQGWAPDFIPKLTEDALALGLVDEVVPIDGFEALRLARELATHEGILVGISGGATLAGALTVCRRLPAGSSVLCMLPDTGERYLSTPLFADVAVDMTDEELELSRSTPSGRFDRPVAPAPAPAPSLSPALSPAPSTVTQAALTVDADDDAAGDFVTTAIQERSQPVVLFALEWCEFCWSLRRLFAKVGVRYRSIDLDSAELRNARWGGNVRAALTARTGVTTIPQLFVGGRFIGGCTEVIDGWDRGTLQRKFEQAGVTYAHDVAVNARSFLPAWLQAR